jgi:hypothetical protein
MGITTRKRAMPSGIALTGVPHAESGFGVLLLLHQRARCGEASFDVGYGQAPDCDGFQHP